MKTFNQPQGGGEHLHWARAESGSKTGSGGSHNFAAYFMARNLGHQASKGNEIPPEATALHSVRRGLTFSLAVGIA